MRSEPLAIGCIALALLLAAGLSQTSSGGRSLLRKKKMDRFAKTVRSKTDSLARWVQGWRVEDHTISIDATPYAIVKVEHRPRGSIAKDGIRLKLTLIDEPVAHELESHSLDALKEKVHRIVSEWIDSSQETGERQQRKNIGTDILELIPFHLERYRDSR